MLDLYRLAILHEFGMRGSIAATAESLGYSPSAISQQLTALERETGAVLLERTARSATLTDAGRLLVRHARTLMRAAEEAEAELSAQLDRVSGSLDISTVPSTAAPVARAVVDVQRDHPDVEIVMRQSLADRAAVEIVEHLTDIVVADDWSSRPGRAPEGLTRRIVYREPIVLAVPAGHLLARARTLTLRELGAAVPELTWLCSPEGHPSRIAGDAILDDLKARPRSRWEFEGLHTIAELVGQGSGCALLPETVARTQPARALRVLPLTPSPHRQLQILTRTSQRTSRTVAACIDAITDSLRAQPGAPTPD